MRWSFELDWMRLDAVHMPDAYSLSFDTLRAALLYYSSAALKFSIYIIRYSIMVLLMVLVLDYALSNDSLKTIWYF